MVQPKCLDLDQRHCGDEGDGVRRRILGLWVPVEAVRPAHRVREGRGTRAGPSH